MNIDPISGPLRINEVKKAAERKKTVTTAAKGTDKVEVSPKGKDLSAVNENVEIIRKQISSSSEVRVERVQEVKERIKEGFYSSDEFVDKLADKLMADFGLR